MLGLGAGGGLIIIAFAAQWLIKKRLKNPKFQTFFRWVAWIFAVLGSAIAAPLTGNSIGVTSIGAGVVSCVLILGIVCDLADKRPDWPAFIMIVILPWTMRWTGGIVGTVFDAALTPASYLGNAIGTLFG
jgi:hypothetical protein